MNIGKIFMAVIFFLIAAYIFFYVSSPAGKIFGGGILTVLGLLSLVKAFKGSKCCGNDKKEDKEEKEDK